MKRILDFAISMLLIILIMPILLTICILIWIIDQHTAIYIQKRIGQYRKEFNMYKFRTMRKDTPEVATHLLNDWGKYITKLGDYLRKTSLDELPQIFNILKGDMSFIGPRPALFNQYDLIQMREKLGVNSIKPGLTGWAQINGRDDITLEKKVELDKYYLDNHSLLLDIKIIYKTIFKVVKEEGVRH